MPTSNPTGVLSLYLRFLVMNRCNAFMKAQYLDKYMPEAITLGAIKGSRSAGGILDQGSRASSHSFSYLTDERMGLSVVKAGSSICRRTG